MVTHSCYPNTQEPETGGKPGLFNLTLSKKKKKKRVVKELAQGRILPPPHA